MSAITASTLRWAAVIAYAALIAFLSNHPVLPAPHVPNIDKVLHAGEYAILAFLLARAALPALRRHSAPTSWALIVLACFLYGIADEAHQAFVPGRSCDPADALADLAGAVLVALLLGRRLRA